MGTMTILHTIQFCIYSNSIPEQNTLLAPLSFCPYGNGPQAFFHSNLNHARI